MNVRKLFTDDRAISPVIGVILMVAITVILAAVIGAFVLNLGDEQSKAPQTKIQFDQRTETPKNAMDWSPGSNQTKIVRMNPAGGETLDESLIDVTVNARQAYNDSRTDGEEIWTGDGEITATSSQRIVGYDADGSGTANAALHDGDEIRITWSAESGGDSATLATHTVE